MPGRYDFCKMLVWELEGNALSFNEAADHLHMRMNWPVPLPKARPFRPAYKDMEMASKLYDTLAELDFGARLRTNAQSMKEHIGVIPPKKEKSDDVVDLSEDPGMLQRFERLVDLQRRGQIPVGAN